jgi:flagellar hook-associated protein FlgK
LSNVPGAQGATITVSRSPLQPDVTPGTYIAQEANALGANNGVLPGPEVANLTAVQLGFGTGTPVGTPEDLLNMGFRTGAYIKGAVKDDLLVFVSGAGTAMVSASYAGKPSDARQSLRANPMTVTFTDATHYQIVDNNTGTIVAERVLDPLQLSPAIRYQGLSLSFTAAPKANDTFTMDGNKDGVGNNDNMLAISALETKAVVGKKTLSNAYIDQINEMGNISRQAAISQTALTVVHDQALKSRDTISGVSLDQEAADLIRYQQAYQASAKTLQIAGQLFDTVLHVN